MASPTFAAGAYAAVQRLAKPGGGAPTPISTVQEAGGGGFAGMLRQAVEGVAARGQAADAQALKAVGGRGDLVDVVTSVAESEAALETLVALRDKAVAAYEEIMRMPI